MSDKNQSSYRSIFKATSILGGVQAYKIVIQVIKSKVVALLIGPQGYGIFGLYTSIQYTIQSLTSFGISSSAVREISEAAGTGDSGKINRVSSVLRRLVWITGLIGAITLIVLSPFLSNKVFGSSDYVIPLIILSTSLLLEQLSAGQLAILQGLHKVESLAKASAIGATIGLLITIPFYYFWGVKGIVPTMVLYSLATLCVSSLFVKKLGLEKEKLTNREVYEEGQTMLKLGIALSLSSIFSSVVALLIRSYINKVGGAEQVGFYTSGAAIFSNYVGLIFTALTTDYYPRLAAVNKDNNACRDVVNQEGEMATLILTPMLVVCMLFMPLIIRILYSSEFLAAYDYIIWASFGMLLRLSTWLISYQLPAKKEGRLYVINELIYSIYSLILSVVGYKMYGLRGLGIGYSLAYLIYFIQIYLLAKKKWGFSFTKDYQKIQLICWILMISIFGALSVDSAVINYAIGAVVVLLSILYSYRELDKRMSLSLIIKNRLKNRNEKDRVGE